MIMIMIMIMMKNSDRGDRLVIVKVIDSVHSDSEGDR